MWPFSLRVCVVFRLVFGWESMRSTKLQPTFSWSSLMLIYYFVVWLLLILGGGGATALGCGVCGVTGDVFISLSTIFHNHHKDVPYSVVERVRHWNVASVALLWKSPGKENNRLTTKKFQQIERSCHFSSFGFSGFFGFSMHSIRCCQSIREWRIVVECLFSYWTFCDDDIVHIFYLKF